MEAPRCPGCQRYMQVNEDREQIRVYECCEYIKTMLKPEYNFLGERHEPNSSIQRWKK